MGKATVYLGKLKEKGHHLSDSNRFQDMHSKQRNLIYLLRCLMWNQLVCLTTYNLLSNPHLKIQWEVASSLPFDIRSLTNEKH